MERFSCLGLRFGRKKKGMEGMRTVAHGDAKPSAAMDSDSVSSSIAGHSVMKDCRAICGGGEASEGAYEAEDEQMTRDWSDADLHVREGNSCEEDESKSSTGARELSGDDCGGEAETRGGDPVQGGHASDPGIGKAGSLASPKLKRSCSNLETRDILNKMAPPLEELQWWGRLGVPPATPGSPSSAVTHRSADRVMLKKHSSSQVLPSRSRGLRWKLFLRSHRNLHRPSSPTPKPRPLAANPRGGYSSDTLEPPPGKAGSFTGECGASRLWPQNQWVAFSIEPSSSMKVEEWMRSLETEPPAPISISNGEVLRPASPPETNGSPAGRSSSHQSEDALHANVIVRSLNSSSTVAHVAGIGLRAIPAISSFSSLRSVNLSNNFIVHISPGSLPCSLHTLICSKNRISTVEGLRELTRLRVLDLSYNRICRIGHGLSKCTRIKELYLAGNRIGDVEGLHRLPKLVVLDLSFNKIATTKAVGQLVANYHSLQALNLLGNPVQSNLGDEQLQKAVRGLLPRLAYLNRQPTKQLGAREAAMDTVARAALGDGDRRTYRRKADAKRGSLSGYYGGLSRSRSSSKSRNHRPLHQHRHSPLKNCSSAMVN